MKTIRNKIQIEVKQRHIKKGVQKNCYSCPIALALQEKFGIYSNPSVSPWRIFLEFIVDNETEITLTCHSCVPKAALNFMKEFDSKKKARPFNFHLEFWREGGGKSFPLMKSPSLQRRSFHFLKTNENLR